MSFNFNDYQKEIVESRIIKKDSIIDYLAYGALGLVEEGAEFAGRLKKIIRDKNSQLDEDDKVLLRKELGDTLWYIADLAYDLGYSLEDIAKQNLEKVRDRQKRNVVKGEGDNR